MRSTHSLTAALLLLLLLPVRGAAQEGDSRPSFEGTAVVTVVDSEYTIPIICDDASRPELGFFTEPSRITRERTGRSSMIGLRVRPSTGPGELTVTLDRYVAWMPAESYAGGLMSATIDMSPVSELRNNMPVLLTREEWHEGYRPEGLNGVKFEANCGFRDPAAPAFRKVREPGGA